jgi:hypothetical protein
LECRTFALACAWAESVAAAAPAAATAVTAVTKSRREAAGAPEAEESFADVIAITPLKSRHIERARERSVTMRRATGTELADPGAPLLRQDQTATIFPALGPFTRPSAGIQLRQVGVMPYVFVVSSL